jgi:pimeloyl-ACP methyl ester carboxylesterase
VGGEGAEGVCVDYALAAAASGELVSTARAQTQRKTFVLVHGAWHGGWCWRRVSDLLEAKGHKVFTPTLTGVGERSHLLTKDINLATHVTDVVNMIKWEDLKDIVLVGHSYAGCVIAPVAEQMEGRISSIVFLDAFFPENGESLVDVAAPPVREAILGAKQKGVIAIPRARPQDRTSTRWTAPGSTRCAPRTRSIRSSTR